MAAENVPWFPALMCFLQYSILITFGHMRDIWAGLSGISRYKSEEGRKGLAKLLIAWESFYTRRLYHRVQDVFNRPVTGAPGTVRLPFLERISTHQQADSSGLALLQF